MPVADKLYITHIHHRFDGDTFFPAIDSSIWKLSKNNKVQPDEKNKFSFSFCEYVRKGFCILLFIFSQTFFLLAQENDDVYYSSNKNKIQDTIKCKPFFRIGFYYSWDQITRFKLRDYHYDNHSPELPKEQFGERGYQRTVGFSFEYGLKYFAVVSGINYTKETYRIWQKFDANGYSVDFQQYSPLCPCTTIPGYFIRHLS